MGEYRLHAELDCAAATLVCFRLCRDLQLRLHLKPHHLRWRTFTLADNSTRFLSAVVKRYHRIKLCRRPRGQITKGDPDQG